MSHAISNLNNRNNMAYVGETPWHGLGQKLEAGLSIEEWTKAAGLDYEVKMQPVYFRPLKEQKAMKFNGKNVIFRTVGDLVYPYATVSDRYHPVQPNEVMSFFGDLTKKGGFEMETAGVLYDGRKLWAMASVGKEAKVKDDVIKPYLMLATAYDGTLATVAKFTSVRVVCQNTLSAALQNAKHEHTVKVRHNTKFDAKTVQTRLGIEQDSWKQFIGDVKQMADAKLDVATAEAWLEQLLKDVYRADDPRNKGSMFNEIMGRFNGQGIGMDMDATKNTVWGMVNAVTEYVDWVGSKSQDNRLNSAWFGLGATLKDTAFDRAKKQLVNA